MLADQGTVTTQDTVEFDQADLEPISSASSADALQRIMDTARAGAEAQAELEAQGIDPTSPAEEEPHTETPSEGESTEESAEGEPVAETQEPEEQEPEGEPESTEHEAEEPKPKPKPGEPTYSRRDAARFKADLDTARGELQQTRAQLQQHQTSDGAIIKAIAEQAGSEQEFQALSAKVLANRATDEERQRAGIMQQWRQVAGPIYRLAQQQVVSGWTRAFEAAGAFDGMDDESRQQINGATDPRTALELIHGAGVRSAEERVQAEAKAEQKKLQGEITRLKAEVSSLKTRATSARPQPAAPEGTNGAASPKLPPMLLDDGSLNPEFQKLAASGKLYGVEKLVG